MADNRQVEQQVGKRVVHLNGVRADPAGVQELILRGMSIDEMVEISGLSYTAILQAAATLDFATLRAMHAVEVMSREFRMERVRMAALERLAELATNLSAEYPEGMTTDQARAIDAQRRAIISALRLPPFPTLRDSFRDVQAPSSGGGSARTNDPAPGEPAWNEFNRAVKDEVGEVIEAAALQSVEAGMEAFARVTRNGASRPPAANQREAIAQSPAGDSCEDARERPNEGGPAKAHAAAADANPGSVVRLTQSHVPANGHSAAPGFFEDAGDASRKTNEGEPPEGLNRAARRRLEREQRRKGHSRHPP